MLIISRRAEQVIRIGDDIKLKVIEIRGGIVRLGFEAPKEVPVWREEIYEAIKRGEPQKAK